MNIYITRSQTAGLPKKDHQVAISIRFPLEVYSKKHL